MRPSRCSNFLAPSSSLLRFLRAQTENICFSSLNATGSITHPCSQGPLKTFPQSDPRNISVRRLSITARRYALVDTSLLHLDCGRNGPHQTIDVQHYMSYTSLFSRHFQCPREGRSTRRFASSDAQSIFQKLWNFNRDKPQRRLKPDDLPPLPAFMSDGTTTLGRSAGKASNELKLRCTEFDENGNVTLVNGEFKKSELIAKYGLLPRDLRKIDSSLLPHILVRPEAILINLLHLRVLIKHNCVLVFDAYGSTDSYAQSSFMYDLEGKLRQKDLSRSAGGLPYEFRALEAVMVSVTSGLETEFEIVRESVVGVLRELEEDIDREKLRHLLIYSKRLGTFEQKARLVRDAIDGVLEEDEDLAAMYLTEHAQKRVREEEDHTEVEMLLESYHKVCDEIVQASSNLISNIRNTEEIVKAILDANRNSLMLLDLKFSIGTLGIGSGAFIAALYGMNLKNFWEDSDFGFLGISAFSFGFAAIVCSYGLTKLRKVQRVSMWGEQGRKSRGSWRDVAPLPALPGETRFERMQRLKEARHLAMQQVRDETRVGFGGEGTKAGIPVPALRDSKP